MGTAVSPDGKNVYVASLTDLGSVVVFDRTPSTGVVAVKSGTKACFSVTGNESACRVRSELEGSNSIAISPNGKNVYVASTQYGAVTIFSRNTTNGELTASGCIASNATERASSCTKVVGTLGTGCCYVDKALAVSPDGKNVYVTGYNSSSLAEFARNTTTGALTQLTGTNKCISDAVNGTADCTKTGRAMNGIGAVVVSKDGKNVYGTAWDGNAVPIFTRNLTTGALTQPAGTAGCASQDGTDGSIGINGQGGNGGNGGRAATVGNTGSCVSVAGVTYANTLTMSTDDKQVYVAAGEGQIAVLKRNTSTGALTQASDGTGCLGNRTDAAGHTGACTAVYASTNDRLLTNVIDIVSSPDGRNVYAASDYGVIALDRNRATGVLSKHAGTDGFCVVSANISPCLMNNRLVPIGLSISPDGRNLYAASKTPIEGSGGLDVINRERASNSFTATKPTATVRRGSVSVKVRITVPIDGEISVQVKLLGRVVCFRKVNAYAAGTITVTCPLARSVRTRLSRDSIVLSLAETFSPVGGDPARKDENLFVRWTL